MKLKQKKDDTWILKSPKGGREKKASKTTFLTRWSHLPIYRFVCCPLSPVSGSHVHHLSCSHGQQRDNAYHLSDKYCSLLSCTKPILYTLHLSQTVTNTSPRTHFCTPIATNGQMQWNIWHIFSSLYNLPLYSTFLLTCVPCVCVLVFF